MRMGLYVLFLQLVRLGIGSSKDVIIPHGVDWAKLKALADRQGLAAIVLDGIGSYQDSCSKFQVSSSDTVPLQLKLEWIADVLQNYEQRYAQYKNAIISLARFYNQLGCKMMVLKGFACSLDWPKPKHRPCGDVDIWLFGQQKYADAEISSEKCIKIDCSHHHHTVFEWEGFRIENHYDFVNVYAHKSSRELEVVFKELGKDDSHFEEVNGNKVYLPSPNLHALFLIKHMVSHFAAAEITLRQILDWAFFVEKHTTEIDWSWLVMVLEKYHMKDFFNIINAICVGDLGFDVCLFPSVQFDPFMKERVLMDILVPAYSAAEPRGILKRMVYKYKRWQGNAWKQRMCYSESRSETFFTGMWSHIIKPS